MSCIPKCIKEDFYQLIPMSVHANCACCVLYDWHPRDDKKIDLTVCLKGGYIQEYYKKHLINSIKIDGKNFEQIKILRNSLSELFYLVFAEPQIIILLRKEKLSVHRIINDVQTYEIVDSECTGEAKLKIVTSSSVINLSIDNNFNDIDEESSVSTSPEDTKPIFNNLKQKLNEAKYNLECNENAYKNILNLRQSASYSSLESDGQIENLTPSVIFCNKKILIILKLKNPCDVTMEKVCTLIHNNSCSSISYTSMLFEALPSSPFYREIENQKIKGKETAVIVTAIPVKEFDSSVIRKIDFNVVVSYQKNERSYLQPCHNVFVSASEVMGNNFDVFSSEVYNYPENLHLNMPVVLALLSATQKTTLCIKQILTTEREKATPHKFCKWLQMECLGRGGNVIVLKDSPHHILYGIMLIFHEVVENDELFEFKIDVYSRSPSQVLALIHFIYDSIPLELIVTTPNIEITGAESRLTLSQSYDEQMDDNFPQLDYTNLATSLLKQASMTLEYFDECLKKSNTKNSDVHNIDVFAMGFEKFAEYRRNMIAEAEKGIQHLPKAIEKNTEEKFDESMEIE